LSGAYRTYGRNEKCAQNFGRKPEGKTHLGDQGVDGRIIKIDFKQVGFENVGWIILAQSRDQWRTVANTVMSLGLS